MYALEIVYKDRHVEHSRVCPTRNDAVWLQSCLARIHKDIVSIRVYETTIASSAISLH